MKLLTITGIFLLSLSTYSYCETVIRNAGEMIDKGDNVQEIYRIWGNPIYRIRSEKSCGRIIKHKKTYCSTSRLVWNKDNRFWLIQTSGNMIIKIDWTKFESNIADEI